MRPGLIVAILVGLCAVAGAQPIPDSNDATKKLDAELRDQEAKRDFTAQEKTIKKLIEEHKKLSGEDSIYVWRQEQALISVYQQTNDQAKAVELADKMLVKAECLHGKDSREVYDVIGYKIAAFQIARAFDADLEPLFQRVLAISRKLYGEKSQNYAFELQRYADHLSVRGETQAALLYQEQAYKIEKSIGADTKSRALQIGLLYMQIDMNKAK